MDIQEAMPFFFCKLKFYNRMLCYYKPGDVASISGQTWKPRCETLLAFLSRTEGVYVIASLLLV